MNPKALFIGSIGVVAETSELQRKAYNQAMSEFGISWEWDIDIYKELLKSSGGQNRLRTLSQATNHVLSDQLIEKIHARKIQLACEMIIRDKVPPRSGLVALIRKAQQEGLKVAWVTSTGNENTDAILQASNGQLEDADFDYIFHREDAKQGKPAPYIYYAALQHFRMEPSACIAVEDSLNSVLAAKGAGIFTIATLGAYHDEQVENIADIVATSLDQLKWSDIIEAYQQSLAHSSVDNSLKPAN